MKRLLLTLAFLLPGPALAQDDGDGGFLENLIEENLSGAGREVRVEGFEGALSSRATIDELTIADSEGVWLRIENAVLDWNRSALLRRRLEVTELSAETIELLRRPVTEPAAPSPEATGFSLPELPVAVRIEELHADELILGEPILGEAAVLTLDGSVALADGEGTASIEVVRIDAEEGRLVLDGSYTNETGVLDLTLALEEGPDGIVASFLNLPGRPSVALGIEGTGAVSDFTADIRLATGGEERLAGQFQTAEVDGARQFRTEISGDIAPVFLPEYQEFFGPNIALRVAGTREEDGTLVLSEIALDAAALALGGEVVIGPDNLPDRVDLTGRIADPDGGPVLLPVAGAETRVGEVDLSVQFDASQGEDWTARLVVEALERAGFSAESLVLEGSGRIGDAPERAVTAGFDFTAEALDLGDPAAAEALGQTVTGRAEIVWQEGEPVEVNVLRLDGESYSLAAEGEVRGLDSALTLAGEAEVTARDLSAFTGLAGRPLSGAVEARVTGEGEVLGGAFDLVLEAEGQDLAGIHPRVDPLLAGQAELALSAIRDETGTTIREFRVETPELTATANGILATEASRLELEARLSDLAAVEPSLSGPATLTARATEAEDTWSFTIEAAGAGAELTAEGEAIDLAGDPVVQGTATVTAADLEPFSTLAGRPLDGALEAQVEGGGRVDLSRLEVTLEAAGEDLGFGIAGTGPLLDGRSTLALTASRDGDTAAVDRLVVETAGIAAQASGTLTGLDAVPVFDGRIAVDAESLAPLSELARRDLDGALEAEVVGQIAADLSTLDLTLDATGQALDLGLPGEEELLGGTATVTGQVAREGDTARLTNVRVTSENLRARVDGVVTALDTTPAFEGSATLAADDLTPLEGLVGRPFAGSIGAEAEGRIAFDLSEADITLRATAEDLQPGLPGDAPLLPGPTQLVLEATRSGDTARIDVLDLENENISLEAEGELTGLMENPAFDGRIALSVERLAPLSGIAGRPLAGSVDAEAAGRLAFDLGSFDLTLDATTDGLSVGQADADRLLGGTATIALDAAREGDRITVREAEISSNELQVSAEGQIGEGAADSRLTIEARLADIAPYAPGLSGPATVEGVIADAPGGGYSVDVEAEGPGGISAAADGTVAKDFSSVDLSLVGDAPLALANRALAPRSLVGTLRFDVQLEGPPELGSVTGTLSTADARLVAPTLGFVLEDIDADVRLTGAQAIVSATAAVQAGGRIALSGPIALAAPFLADLDGSLQSVRVVDPALYTTTVSGPVSVTGPLAGGARIAGNLGLGETEIRIPSTGLGGTFALPEVTHVNTPVRVARTLDRAGIDPSGESGDGSGDGGGGAAYPLDILIRAENRIFIRGRGLDAELGGQLRLTGTTADIVPAGQFDLIRGRLDILGQRIVLDEGSVTLQGDFVPYVRLVARTDTGEVVVFVIVEGRASEPEITFESEPELPEDEVLAQLLFGRSIENISPLQAAQLASAAATLAGRGGGGIFEQLRTGFGLDDFDVTTDAEGNAAVRAGAYISENLYTDVTVAPGGETEINLNLDLTESTVVRGSVGTEGETSLGIYFERDY